MKNHILILLFAGLSGRGEAQTSGSLIGSYSQPTSNTTFYCKIQDVATGAIALSNLLTGVNHEYGKNTYDEAGKRYFYTNSSGISVIDAQTGMVTSTLTPPTYFDALEYNSNTGKLVGVAHYISDVFFTIDISTGATTTLSTIPTQFSPQLNESTFDAAGNRHFYRLTAGSITVLNAATGAFIKTITTGLESMEFNPNSGELIGCVFGPNNSIKFCRIDPSSGLITYSVTLTGVQQVYSGDSTFDKTGNRYFISTDLGITIINPSTGAIIATIPRSVRNMEYTGGASTPVKVLEIEGNSKSSLRVYPNPSSTLININYEVASKNEKYWIVINTCMGQEVYKQEIVEETTSLDVSLLPGRGIYYLRLMAKDNKTVETRKLVLE